MTVETLLKMLLNGETLVKRSGEFRSTKVSLDGRGGVRIELDGQKVVDEMYTRLLGQLFTDPIDWWLEPERSTIKPGDIADAMSKARGKIDLDHETAEQLYIHLYKELFKKEK